jgi:hypothetical protein
MEFNNTNIKSSQLFDKKIYSQNRFFASPSVDGYTQNDNMLANRSVEVVGGCAANNLYRHSPSESAVILSDSEESIHL